MNLREHDHEPLLSAYKACHSTEIALVWMQSDILFALDNKDSVILLYFDLSVTFDTMDHFILFTKMDTMLGVKRLALD